MNDKKIITTDHVPVSTVCSKVSVRYSVKHGQGVFAVERINQHERIAVFGGYAISIDTLQGMEYSNPTAYEVVLRVGYQVADDVVFSPIAEESFSVIEYLNHSCDPNCGFSDQITLVAIRSIEAGEELSMDYGLCITSTLFEMDCACGAKQCRGQITAEDWKSPELQQKMHDYFQPYIRNKFIHAG